ncbi:MAG: hypothetical protein ABI158_03825 [Edaphobacter sp.]
MTNKDNSFWTSTGNLIWVSLALLALAAHAIIQHKFPNFTPPATLDKPTWMRTALYGELFVHILFLGAVIVGIRNRIPNLKRPSYSDDGTLSIGSSQLASRATTRWSEIAGIIVEFSVYLLAWAWIYGNIPAFLK